MSFGVAAASYVGPANQQSLPGTVLARWPLHDSLVDISGNGRNGTAEIGDTGVPWTPEYVDGPFVGTRALRIATTSAADYSINWGRAGLEPTTLGWTVMYWFRALDLQNGTRGNAIFVRARATDSTRGGAVIGSGISYRLFTVTRWKDDLKYWDNIDVGMSSGVLSDWHHMAIVDTDVEYRVYVDGVEVVGGTRSLDSSAWVGWENYPWRTGWADETLASANGELQLSQLRMFHGGLTQAEIQQAMNTYD